MANDSWMPRKFAALSERLTTQNGILLMGLAAMAALIYTRGHVGEIVVMYSINVFITFSMTESAMCKMFFSRRRHDANWKRDIWIHVLGLAMCLTILVVTVFEKFLQGGWITLIVTGALVALCFVIRRHYREVVAYLKSLDQLLAPAERIVEPGVVGVKAPDPKDPTAVILVGGYSGLGVHTIFHVHRTFPRHFKNMVFVSVGVIDSGTFKGRDELEALKAHTEASLKRYTGLANRLGFASDYRLAVGTDVVETAVDLCLRTASEFSHAVFFAGQLVFAQEKWFQRILHNQTAFSIQRHLQWHDRTMVILPIRVRKLPPAA
jgi:K+ transporter